MFIFCLCDVGYWIRVNTVQKVKRKNKLPKYFGSFSAEVRTGYFFQVSSPFRGILRRNSEAITAHLIAFGGPRYTNILQIRGRTQNAEPYSMEYPMEYLKWSTPKNHVLVK